MFHHVRSRARALTALRRTAAPAPSTLQHHRLLHALLPASSQPRQLQHRQQQQQQQQQQQLQQQHPPARPPATASLPTLQLRFLCSSSSAAASLKERALQWAEWDTNAETAAAVRTAANSSGGGPELEAAFGSRVAFGTAGLRAEMGYGPARMNELTVLQATQGLVAYLESALDGGAAELRERGLAIGFDHRARGTLNSETFGRLAAAVCLQRGVRVKLLTGLVPTPLVPFAVEKYGCAAGVMVTASHNPKEDNGYKVYWGNGAQIVPPHDAGIAAQIEANLAPWSDGYAEAAATVVEDAEAAAAAAAAAGSSSSSSALCEVVTAEVADGYFAAMAERLCRRGAAANGASDVKAVYSAMHGVGGQWAARSVRGFGFDTAAPGGGGGGGGGGVHGGHGGHGGGHMVPVPAQQEPDPEFPTVAFPNPEEGAGALALSFARAAEVGATLILANDPDADRLAVAERTGGWGAASSGSDGSSSDGDGSSGQGWRLFTGNEIGALLGAWQWECHVAGGGGGSVPAASLPAGAHPLSGQVTMLASTVSSKFLGALAAAEGFTFEETLTGFKWMGSRTEELRAAGGTVLFSYEEAIGFCIGDVVKDKDGVSAAAVFLELAAALRDRGEVGSVGEHLDGLYAKYGHFVANNHYLKCYDGAVTDAIFARLRGADGATYPAACGGALIASVRDLTTGVDTAQPDGKATMYTDPSSHMITFTFANGCVATLRTSGTEPKIKFYVEQKGAPGQPREEVAAEVDRMAQAVVEEMLQPELNNLERPQ